MKKNVLGKITIAILVVTLYSSCSVNIPVVSKEAYDNVNVNISKELLKKGFNLYGSSQDNGFRCKQEYRFSDSADRIVSYSVEYNLKEDKVGMEYVEDLKVIDCNCNNYNDYNVICGDDVIVKNNINTLKESPDKLAKVTDVGSSVIVGILGGGAFMALIVCLLMFL